MCSRGPIMNRVSLYAGCLLSLTAATTSYGASTAPAHAPATLSDEQIVERNVAARGGLAAWREAKNLTITGEMDASGHPNHALPFVLNEKHPRESRLEI